MGILEKFKRKLAEASGDDLYFKVHDKHWQQCREEASENHRIVEEILALLKGKKAERAKSILQDAFNKILEKQMDTII